MNLSFFKVLALTGGDWVIYGLLLCSVVAVAIIIEKWIVLRREQKDFHLLRADLLKNIKLDMDGLEKTVARHPGAAGRVLKTALGASSGDPEEFGDLMVSASLEEKNFLEKHLLALGTLGNNAPFIGLFGTVLGVIKAFHDLSSSGAGPEAVMEGLSTALIATAVGLFVAIPSVVGYNYFQKKAKDLLSGTESLGRLLLARVRTSKSSRH